MQKIRDILWKSLAKYDLTASAFSLTVIYRMRNHLVNMFWYQILKNVNVEKYQNQIVFIKCFSAAWAQEIQLVKQDLIDLIKQDFPEKSCFNIKIYH